MSFGIFFEVIECSSRKGESLVFNERSMKFDDFYKCATSTFIKQINKKKFPERVQRLSDILSFWGPFSAPFWLCFCIFLGYFS